MLLNGSPPPILSTQLYLVKKKWFYYIIDLRDKDKFIHCCTYFYVKRKIGLLKFEVVKVTSFMEIIYEDV